MNSWICASRAAASISAREAEGRPYAMLPASVSPNSMLSCKTRLTCSRTERSVRSRASRPSRSTAPESGSWNRGTSPARVDLPLPVGPTMATRAPAGASNDTLRSTGIPAR